MVAAQFKFLIFVPVRLGMSEDVNPETAVLFLPCATLQVLSVSVCISCLVPFAESHSPSVTRILH